MWDRAGTDDEEWRSVPPPADDRLWRHPSEMAALRPPETSDERRSTERHRYSLGTVVVAGSLGALTMLAALAALGQVTGGPPSDDGAVTITTSTDSPGTGPQLAALDALPDGVLAVRVSSGSTTRYGAALIIDRWGDLVTTLDLTPSSSNSLNLGSIAPDPSASPPMSTGTAMQVEVERSNGSWSPAVVVGTDEATGLGVLQLAVARGAAPANVSGTRLGEEVRLVRPGSVPAPIQDTKIRVTGVNCRLIAGPQRLVGMTMITSPGSATTTDVAIDPGDGSIAALISPIDDNPEDELTYAVPADLAVRIGRQIVLDGNATHGGFDAALTENGQGELVVSTVTANGRAATAGLAVGDIVVSVAGHQVHSNDDVEGALLGLTPADSVNVVARRATRQLSLKVQIAPPAPAVTTP